MTTAVASARPVTSVWQATRDGARSVPEIARRTGLNEAIVRAAVDHLARTGRLVVSPLSVSCPVSGCGDCRGCLSI